MTTLGQKKPQEYVILKTFQLTLHGYDGSTDETDHLIKWVQAPSLRVLERWLNDSRLMPYLQEPPEPMPHFDDAERAIGIDVILDLEGNADLDTIMPWMLDSQEAMRQQNRRKTPAA